MKEDKKAIENLEKYLKPFSRCICEIFDAENEKTVIQQIHQYFENFPIKETVYGHEGRVWILIGKRNNEPYKSLMVAQSENIYDEIVKDVMRMFNHIFHENDDGTWKAKIQYDLDVIKGPKQSENKEDNYFFQPGDKQGKISYFYRNLKKQYDVLKFYEIEIDAYLEPERTMNSIENSIYELAKDYYCEAKLAIKTASGNWETYRSGIGKRIYYMLLAEPES
ncbi:MAG: hypothetical protein PHX08_19960 [Lachnospiraceae bacterium]|nr:hypothetical protein [Lachnospiraceae bacterium]